MIRWPTALVQGQESFLLETRTVHAALTCTGGMLAPVTFFADSDAPIQPYAVAPWAEEPVPAGTPSMLATLRGDWFCSTFGANDEPYRGCRLPPHGETANRAWQPIAGDQSQQGCWLRLAMDLPLQGGRCEATTTLIAGHSVVYQRHDLQGLSGPANPGHHATLAFPDDAGFLSFSRLQHARTLFEAVDRAENRSFSCLKPDIEITDLRTVPCIDGSRTDLSRYPARRGYEDLVILCADPALEFAWSAVVFPEQGYVWFSLRDPRHLASTVLWFSNGGRLSPPWSGRHVNVMGIEDVTAFFAVGLAASCRENSLTRRGIRTCLDPGPCRRLSIPYVQGVAHLPSGFDRVATIDAIHRHRAIRLRSDSGVVLDVLCEVSFLQTGMLSTRADADDPSRIRERHQSHVRERRGNEI